MRHALLKATVACTTLATGLMIGWIHQHSIKRHPAPPPPVIVPIVVPVPVAQASTVPEQDESDESYPDNLGLNPSDIEDFIYRHPEANLDPLWQRLKITKDNDQVGFGGQCGFCKAQTSYYNLDDNDAAYEAVLRIADDLRQSYRYLIFKIRSYDDTPLLGHIDAHGKYRASTHTVFLSSGKAWLVVEEQAANGSGLAAYIETVYAVSSRSVRPIVSYFSEVWESGWSLVPTKHFIGHLVSCEAEGSRARVTVSYHTVYGGERHDENALFAKRQVVVLAGSLRGGLTINESHSNMTSHEFDTVYNYFSLDEGDFLRYNRPELRAIAVGKDSDKRQWLKEFLEKCSNNAIKRELLTLLH